MRLNKPRLLARTLSPNPLKIIWEPDPGPTAEINPSDIKDSNSDDDSKLKYTPINL